MFSNVLSSASFRQFAVVIIVNLNFISAGLTRTWTSPVLVKLRNATNPALWRPITETEGSWIASIGFVGSTSVSIVVLFLIDCIGRRNTIIIGAIPRVIGCTLLVFTKEVWMVILAKFLSGISDGCMFAAVPIYATEISSKEIRGGLGVLLSISLTTGLVIMLCVGPFLEYFSLNIILLSVTVTAAIPVIFLPESPYFLSKKGNQRACLKSLTFLRASKAIAEREMFEYESREGDKQIDFKVIFRSKLFLKSLVIVVVMGAGAELVGLSAMSTFLQTILEASKTNISSDIASFTIGILQLVCCLLTAFTTDRFGRKPIFVVCLIGEFVGMVALGTYFYVLDSGTTINGVWNYVPLISLILVVGFLRAGVGCLLMPLLSELFDGRSRSVGVFFGVLTAKVFGFLMTRYITDMINICSAAYTYWFLALMCVILCLFIILFVPETKGKSLEEIQFVLGKKKPNII